MIFGKPLQATVLNLLLKHIEMNGTLSMNATGMKLIEISNNLEWVPKL